MFVRGRAPKRSPYRKGCKIRGSTFRVDPIDMTKADFKANEGLVRKGIETAASLLDWYAKMHPSANAAVQPNSGLRGDAAQAPRA